MVMVRGGLSPGHCRFLNSAGGGLGHDSCPSLNFKSLHAGAL